MTLLALCYVCLVLLDIEKEPPLLNLQDDGGYPPGQGRPYYLCYRYPRPNYWVEKARCWAEGLLLGKE